MKVFFDIVILQRDSLHKGSIPTEIGLLSNLTRLRLSYNEFFGDNVNLLNLQRLDLIHLQGNRLSGSLNFTSFSTDKKQFTKEESYSLYVSDCGNPSDFSPLLACEKCTICCETLFLSQYLYHGSFVISQLRLFFHVTR